MTREKKRRPNGRIMMLRVRVNVTEKAALEKAAKDGGMTLSDWIRSKSIAAKPRLRKVSSQDETNLRILAALGKCGSNMNQIARQLNRKQDSDEFVVPINAITYLLNDFKQISNQLRQLIYGDHKGED